MERNSHSLRCNNTIKSLGILIPPLINLLLVVNTHVQKALSINTRPFQYILVHYPAAVSGDIQLLPSGWSICLILSLCSRVPWSSFHQVQIDWKLLHTLTHLSMGIAWPWLGKEESTGCMHNNTPNSTWKSTCTHQKIYIWGAYNMELHFPLPSTCTPSTIKNRTYILQAPRGRLAYQQISVPDSVTITIDADIFSHVMLHN